MDPKGNFDAPCSEDIYEGDKSSAENFQKFIYTLFEKNGVISDLRAYLRRHIVNMLKSVDTGEKPACQKRFSQRLEPNAQAINVLVAEYLLRSDFNYSLSVFLSEIPLANMVFDFAKEMMKTDDETTLRFKESDVYSVLNYLGIKCDSSFVNKVLESYKGEENTPLLMCILKNMNVAQDTAPSFHRENSPSSLTVSSGRTSSACSDARKRRANKHSDACEYCYAKMCKWRERYKKTKELNKMFEQMRSVYEAELSGQEERARQRSQADRASITRALKAEMEATYKAREEELERAVRAKKKFLWELARSLRAQHDRVTQAVRAIKFHSQRLNEKENQLKIQIAEAENLLRRRGKDIKDQISSELSLLENQLKSVRKEREAVESQRSQLELMKTSNSTLDIDDIEKVTSSYTLLSKELSVLKKYFNAARLEPRCLIERGTVTDQIDMATKNNDILNNETNKETREEDRVKNNQVVNDFKKQKNVNFCVNNDEGIDSGDTSGAYRSNENVTQLKQENERLRDYLQQQEQLVRELACGALPAAAARSLPAPARSLPAPARPAPPPRRLPVPRPRSAGPTLTRSGPAEEPCGEMEPLIGLLRSGNESRRLLNQWHRSRRASPRRSPRRPTRETPAEENASSYNAAPVFGGLNTNQADVFKINPSADVPQTKRPDDATSSRKIRSKSPKSVLKEAKEKLKSNIKVKKRDSDRPSSSREKSPASVLREAKLRLRKLEIEAQAVEQSYLDFRKRHSERHERERYMNTPNEEAIVTKDIGDLSIQRDGAKFSNRTITKPNDINMDFAKYLRDYTRSNIESINKLSETRFANRNTAAVKVKPIPKPFAVGNICLEKPNNNINNNYLATPLNEFRKYYTQPRTLQNSFGDNTKMTSELAFEPHNNVIQVNFETKHEVKNKNCKQVDFEILKPNVTQVFNVTTDSVPEVGAPPGDEVNYTQSPEPQKEITIEVENAEIVKDKDTNIVVEVQNKPEPILKPTHKEENDLSLSGRMTVLISPKLNRPDRSRSMSPEQAARLTRNDVLEAIFHTNTIVDSSSVLRNAESKEDEIDSDSENENPDYPDDFSADVDNYEHSRDSPISLPTSQPDDSFWNDG